MTQYMLIVDSDKSRSTISQLTAYHCLWSTAPYTLIYVDLLNSNTTGGGRLRRIALPKEPTLGTKDLPGAQLLKEKIGDHHHGSRCNSSCFLRSGDWDPTCFFLRISLFVSERFTFQILQRCYSKRSHDYDVKCLRLGNPRK